MRTLLHSDQSRNEADIPARRWIDGLAGTVIAISALVSAGVAYAGAEARPNIIFILADDLGYGDLSSYDSSLIKTPAIDSIGQQGIKLTQFYANAPECTPSRTALLTGRYQHRVGGLDCAIGLGNVGRYDDAVWLASRKELGLPASEPSIANMLGKAGYDTAIFGKWHLGHDPKFWPDKHGFKESLVMLGGAADYITHAEPGGAAKLIHNENPVVIEGYSTDVFADRAIEWISRQRTAPYFLYLSLNAPHFPYQAPEHGPASIPWKEGGGWPTQETYRKMVERMDARIADVLAVVDRSPGAANTIVIFTSDNGATATLGSNRPLRGHKGQLYEGGIRVPCLIRWPQVIPAGKTVSQVTLLMDLTATLLAASKVKPPLPLDGIDLRKVLDGTSQDISRTVFWRWQKGKPPVKAVRQEDFKLIVDSGTNHRELYDLAVDPLESSDLFEAMPAKAKALGHLMDTWELEVQAPRLKEFRLLGRQSN